METMTVGQVLEITAENLGNIVIPAKHAEQIGKPILEAIANLHECIRAIREAEQKKKPAEDEPELVIEDIEVSEEEEHA